MHDPNDLLPIAYRAASAVAHSPFLAEEAAERTVHLLTLAVLNDTPPAHPKAWLRVVARRSASALLRSEWCRTRSVPHDEMARHQAHYQSPPDAGTEFVREHVAEVLSPRQKDALMAALSCNTMRGAARSCGMPPRDFRRYLDAIRRKAQRALETHPLEDPFSNDPGVQFCLDA